MKHRQGETWLTVKQAAEHAGVAPSTIIRWLRQGKFPSFGDGSFRRIPLTELDAYMRSAMKTGARPPRNPALRGGALESRRKAEAKKAS